VRERCAWIWDVRGKGLMLGIELAQDRAGEGSAILKRLLARMFHQGSLGSVGGCLGLRSLPRGAIG